VLVALRGRYDSKESREIRRLFLALVLQKAWLYKNIKDF
jgi:hypothetical protein